MPDQEILTPDPEENNLASLPSPEKAFRDSDEIEFQGRKLEPFSFVRQTAAIELGLRYWRLTPDDLYTLKTAASEKVEPLQTKEGIQVGAATIPVEAQEVQMYDGFVMDIAIVLWLCSQPDSECRRARRKPREYEAKIDHFADQNGIYVGGIHFTEASETFAAIVQAINGSNGHPDIEVDPSTVQKKT